MENKSQILTWVVVIILVAAGVGFWYWSRNVKAPEETPTLGGQIFEKTQNPLEGQVPDANPFKDQKNPLDTIYQNPFE
ncbi:MAG: hypothetical protein Q7K16_03395 [Candidatus Azambacteria bacterium]|nr:hypothetical protein [Candidatus Azambacteria bacterium]